MLTYKTRPLLTVIELAASTFLAKVEPTPIAYQTRNITSEYVKEYECGHQKVEENWNSYSASIVRFTETKSPGALSSRELCCGEWYDVLMSAVGSNNLNLS